MPCSLFSQALVTSDGSVPIDPVVSVHLLLIKAHLLELNPPPLFSWEQDYFAFIDSFLEDSDLCTIFYC